MELIINFLWIFLQKKKKHFEDYCNIKFKN